MRGGWRTTTVALALVLAGCGSDGGTVASSTTTSAGTSTVPVSSTSVAPTTTAAGATTAAPTSTTSSDTSAAPTTTAGPLPSADAVLLVVSNRSGVSISLTYHSAADGSELRSVELPFEGFAYDPSTGGDLTVLNTNWEDYWFSCSGYNGIVREVLVDGSSADLVEGGLGQLSADGGHLLYGRASTCGPDEVDQANWVHAPLDTIVWRDVASGQEQAWSFPGAVLDSEERSPVTSLALAGDRIAAVVSEGLVVFDPAVGSPDAAAAPVIDQSGELVELLGARPDGTVVAIRRATSQSGARLIELDPVTGAETEIAAYPNHTLAALHPDGTDLAVLTDGVLTVNGTEVALEGVDTGTIDSIGF